LPTNRFDTSLAGPGQPQTRFSGISSFNVRLQQALFWPTILTSGIRKFTLVYEESKKRNLCKKLREVFHISTQLFLIFDAQVQFYIATNQFKKPQKNNSQ